MKRIGLALAMAAVSVLLVAAPAFAGSDLSNGGPDVEGTGGTAGGTAFTGANVSTSLLLMAALVAVGMLALYVGRRRGHAAR
jgi:LPXTG cell wall anchor motif